MRALHLSAAGAQPKIGEVPTPAATEGTVLIRVKAAGLNPIDNAHVAEDLVTDGLMAPPIQAGAIAEYAVLPAAAVVAKPAALDFVTAAAIPLAGASAAQAVDAVDPQPGQTVLVIGAGGGVGSFGVQLLVQRGVTVIATGSASSADRLRALGATTVIDRADGPLDDQVKASYQDGVDALVNLAGSALEDVPAGAVRDCGKISSVTVAPDEQTVAARTLSFEEIMSRPLRDVIAPLVEQVAAGTLKVSVPETLTFEGAAGGLATIAAGKANGKLVVNLEA